MYHLHHACRACGYGPKLGAEGVKLTRGDERLQEVFSLGLQPLANSFSTDRDEQSGFAPLDVLFCPRCGLAQLSVVVKPEILYSHYLYVTSPSQTMALHFAALTRKLAEQTTFGSVLEIGSNDGAFLRTLKDDFEVMGIDPAANLTAKAIGERIPTICGVFNRDTAEQALAKHGGGFDLVVARHVFCHVDDWRGFMDSLALVLNADGLVAIEVPYVKDLLDRGEFDTIYHEHTSYLNVRAFNALLQDSPFVLQRIESFPIHGGAIVLMLRRRDYGAPIHESVTSYLLQENITADTWKEFSRKAKANMGALINFIVQVRKEGKRVAGMGASAKSTVWVNAIKLTRADMDFVTDTTQQKLWKLIPGSNIPIVDEGAILRELPDYLVLFAWNYEQECIRKNLRYLERGGRIVVPVPELHVVGIDAAKRILGHDQPTEIQSESKEHVSNAFK